MRKILKRGAEALLYLDLEGRVVKERLEKKYRCPQLDLALRKRRTKKEAKLLERLHKLGFPVPKLLEVDSQNFKFVMERVEGKLLKDFLEEGGGEIAKACFEVGKLVAELHKLGVVHNDLTSSNVIVGRDRKLYFIDFGLAADSRRLEDRAVDLVVFKKSLAATHPKIFELVWKALVEGYKHGLGEGWEDTLRRVEQIERRVRYAER